MGSFDGLELQPLPPLPKLRPRPGLSGSKRTPDEVPETSTVHQTDDDEEQSTSRLLMKSDCGKGGAGRKRASGSLVHSIPKFSQVRPNGRLTEVQKMLQSRIISRQQKMQQQQQPQAPDGPGFVPTRTICVGESSNLSASHLLRNIINLHERNEDVSLLASTATPGSAGLAPPLPVPNGSALTSTTSRKRGRKPAKDEICHVVSADVPARDGREWQLVDSRHALRSLLRGRAEERGDEAAPPPELPRLPEVTITPTMVRKTRGEQADGALDLSAATGRRSESPEVIEVSVDPCPPPAQAQQPFLPMLYPSDYERFGMPPGYVFCPNSNVFVHPAVLSPQYLSLMRPKTAASQPDIVTSSSPRPPPPSLESLQGVMRLLPGDQLASGAPSRRRKPAAAATSQGQQGQRTTQEINSEVKLCKFKFTGGPRPSLEEKKSLSVDAVGNFRYFSSAGSGDRPMRGFESLPREALRAGASVVTDRFTSLTADRIARTAAANAAGANNDLAAADKPRNN